MKTGTATITLDYGKCPKWLFERIKTLGGIMSEIIIEEFGVDEFLKRISHPVWFQTLGSLLAFDWNSSGLTVVLTAALKEFFKERNLGIYIAGGKGKTSRKTPEEILLLAEKININAVKYSKISKLVAKVDNSLIQDGFNLYHHSFILTEKGNWAVIQQGMNTLKGLARRYHWYSSEKLTEEPHSGIVSEIFFKKVLNLTSKESRKNKEGMIKVLNEENKIVQEIKKVLILNSNKSEKNLFVPNIEFSWHPVVEEKFDLKRLTKTVEKARFIAPKTIEELLLIEGMGSRTIRALSLVSEVIYGAKPSFEDPARYTFAHGGKDGTPYFVDRQTYDETIKIFNKALKIAKSSRIHI